MKVGKLVSILIKIRHVPGKIIPGDLLGEEQLDNLLYKSTVTYSSSESSPRTHKRNNITGLL